MRRSSVLALSVLRLIKGTLARYLAIFAIIALGVGFFAGLRVSYDAMLKTADRIAGEKGIKTSVGTVFTSDMFYSAVPNAYEKYRDEHMLAVEMETAGIYLTAQHAGKRAVSLLSISDHVFTGEGLSAIERQDSFREMMEVALDTAWEFTD